MANSETPADQSNPAGMQQGNAGVPKRVRLLRWLFCSFVILLAIYQFSENTADVDLWGHVTFGEAMLKTHAIAKTDPYSWTAKGKPWINHECLAEIALGGAHALLGGKGLLLLKMAVGLLSFAIALRIGMCGLTWPERLVVWAVGAAAVVEISYGFAARPQIFTVLFIVLELALLRRIHAGKYLWALAMPVIFALWINTHGGVLAGFGLLTLAAVATTAQAIFCKTGPQQADSSAPSPQPSPPVGEREKSRGSGAKLSKTILVLWLTVVVSGAALLINPWGVGLIRWLVGSVLWLRPEIEEWNPTPLGWDHAVLFALILLAVFAWAFTRHPRAWWELAVCVAFAALALRSVRNTPLCAIVLLGLMPRHLASAMGRFRDSLERFEDLGGNAGFQYTAIALLALSGAGTAAATFTLHKQNPFTMEIPSARFPTAAVDFIRQRDVHGNALVYFDWGEMMIFDLPDCAPSIDGRLDTCYPPEVIKAHWKFYNGDPFDEKVLNVLDADFALLRADLAGTAALDKRQNWRLAYIDDTAAVLVHGLQRFPKVEKLRLPVKGPDIKGLGRVAFPDQSPRAAQAH